jgi:uncharacterized protein Usg
VFTEHSAGSTIVDTTEACQPRQVFRGDVVSGAFFQQLQGRRLTTAEIVYYMPDHPALLQEFLWQTLDQAPDFPRIHRFLDYWRREIDAVIHSVRVSYAGVITPGQARHVDAMFTLN